LNGSIRVTICARGTFAAIVAGFLACPPVHGDILDGLAAIGARNASNAPTNYPGLLQTYRGLNFGGVGIPYAFGHVGADSASILAPGNQVDDTTAKILSGDVTLVTMGIGDNDYIDVADEIISGALSGPALSAHQAQVASNIATAVNNLQAAGGAVVLGGFANISYSPAAAGLSPGERQVLHDALAGGNVPVRDFATSQGMPFIDFFALQTQVYEAGVAQVGGVDLILTGFGSDPHFFFEDQFHAGIIVRAAIANLYLQAINQGFGTSVPLVSDLEILTLAGLEDEYVEDTFNVAYPYASFVTIPEPATCFLATIGFAAILATRARRAARHPHVGQAPRA
jgi:hypothetical protein